MRLRVPAARGAGGAGHHVAMDATTSRFAVDTAVEPLGDGRYRARMDPSWWIVAGPNGGYVAATLLRAVLAEVAAASGTGGPGAVDLGGADGDGDRRLRSATLHYLRPPAAGEVEIEVVLDRLGRSVANTSATMTQDGRLLVRALAAVASPRPSPLAFDEDDRLPALPDGTQVPPPEDLPVPVVDPERDVPMRRHYDLRWALGDLPFRPGAPGPGPDGRDDRRARSGGWIRLAEGDPVDELVLVAMSDAWVPPVFSRVEVPLAVPTVDLTVHLRGRPPAGDPWCWVDFASPVARDGFLVEHGRLRDRRGRLVAESRQLAVVA